MENERNYPNTEPEITEKGGTTMFDSFDALPTVLDVKDLKAFLGIPQSTAYDLMHRADFPTLHLNARLLVTKANLKTWIEAHTNGDYGVQ